MSHAPGRCRRCATFAVNEAGSRPNDAEAKSVYGPDGVGGVQDSRPPHARERLGDLGRARARR